MRSNESNLNIPQSGILSNQPHQSSEAFESDLMYIL